MVMKYNKNFIAPSKLIARGTIILLCAGLVTACENQTAEKPDVIVVSPSPATPAPTTPAPATTPTGTPTTTPTNSSTSQTTTTTTTTTEPITDVTVIVTEPSPQSLVNRRVEFTNVKVQNVNGDRTFWVGQSNNQRLFVVLDPALDKGSAENKVSIKAGQLLDTTGTIKKMPTAAQAQQQWGLSAAEAQAIQNQTIYLQTDTINFKSAT
ncbi:MAG TPA: hypothetical protein V6D15_12595 [Oculatellaceae cyanobacterium]|jgi:hypothetical protein